MQLNSLKVLSSSESVSSVKLMILLNIKCLNIIWSYFINYGDAFEAILKVKCMFLFFFLLYYNFNVNAKCPVLFNSGKTLRGKNCS